MYVNGPSNHEMSLEISYEVYYKSRLAQDTFKSLFMALLYFSFSLGCDIKSIPSI